MNIALVMVTADGKIKELPPLNLPITIGRGDECKLRIPLSSISRKHCELSIEDDELRVRDLRSSNGTFVNKDRVTDRELIPGDLISVGPVVFVVKIDGFPKIIDPVISYANGSVGPEDATAQAPAGDGVPTWSGGQSSKGSGSSAAMPSPSKSAPPAAPAAPARAAKPDSGSFEDLLADLSESDFDDIDLGDDDAKKKTPGKK